MSHSLKDAINHLKGLPKVEWPNYKYGVAEHAAVAAVMSAEMARAYAGVPERAYGGEAEHAEMLYGQFDSKGICGDAPLKGREEKLMYPKPSDSYSMLARESKVYWSKALFDMVSKESLLDRLSKKTDISKLLKVKLKKNKLLLLL